MAGRKPTVSDDEILDVFHQASEPVLTTSEVADQIGLGRRGTFNRLSALEEQGKIQMKNVGQTGAVWWHPNSLRRKYVPSEES